MKKIFIAILPLFIILPRSALAAVKITAISAGRTHACVIDRTRTSKVHCWGEYRGEDRYTSNIVQDLEDAVAISSGEEHSCAIYGRNRNVKCWGAYLSAGGYYINLDGKCPVGHRTDVSYFSEHYNYFPPRFSSAAGVTPELKDVVAISSGGNHSCAIYGENRNVRCWGWYYDGSHNDISSVVPDLEDAVAISSGSDHSCAIYGRNRNVKCWGSHRIGMDSSTHGSFDRVEVDWSDKRSTTKPSCYHYSYRYSRTVAPDLKGAVAISSGDDHACAIYGRNRNVKCWGSYHNPDYDDPDSFTSAVDPKLEDAVAMSSGADHSCAIYGKNRNVNCWGMPDSYLTSAVALELKKDAIAISSRRTNLCAIYGENRNVNCWGDIPDTQHNLTNPVAIATGGHHACAIDGQEGIICWPEYNNSSQINDAVPDELRGPLIPNLDFPKEELLGLLVPAFLLDFPALLTENLPPHKKEFFQRSSEILKLGSELEIDPENLSQAQQFGLLAFKPVIEDLSSDFSEKNIKPDYQEVLTEYLVPHQLLNIGDIPSSVEIEEVALSLIEAALSSSRAFVPDPAQQATIELLISDIGTAIAKLRTGASAEAQRRGIINGLRKELDESKNFNPGEIEKEELGALQEEVKKTLSGLNNYAGRYSLQQTVISPLCTTFRATQGLLDSITLTPHTQGFGLMIQELLEYLEGGR